MAVPSFFEFIHPLLQFLDAHPEGVRSSDAYEAVADRAGLSNQDREELLANRAQPLYQNRIGWAHDRLKRARYSTSPRRGFWQITDDGRRYAATHREQIPENELRDLARPPSSSRLRDIESRPGEVPATTTNVSESTLSPHELIEEALEELTDSVASELLDLIGKSSPTFFEGLVLELLHKMGYGASRADLQRVGGAGDGGIDGIISLDRLGLEKVYIQAKRWQNTVGRPEIQGFFGALAGRRANKGVFITTSSYSRDAIDYARDSGSIVLVDGTRLTELMIEHGVGVSHKPIRVPQVDSDYFEEG